jgi:hypothetical protein
MLARIASGVPGDAARRPVYSHTVAIFFSAILGGGLLGATAWAASPVTVGSEEQISAGNPLINCTADKVSVQEQDGSVNFPSAEVEPYIDVDPNHPDNLIAVWQQDRWSDGGSRALFSAYSDDGGTTWNPVVLPGLTLCDGTGLFERASDPWVTFAPNGDAYAIGLPFDSDPLIFGGNHAVTVNKSVDHGQTWSAPVELIHENDPDVFNDKESITADPTSANRVYATWDRLENFTASAEQAAALAASVRFEHDKVIMAGQKLRQMRTAALAAAADPPSFKGPTMFTRTKNAGASWELPRIVYDPGADNQTINNIVLVQPSGGVVLIFTEILNLPNGTAQANIALKRSTDSGFSFLPTNGVIRAQRIRTNAVLGLPTTVTPDEQLPVRDAGILFDPAVDPNNGNLYLVWQDNRFGNHAVDQIAFSMSKNNGKTWSHPIEINKTPRVPANRLREAAFVPTIAVNSAGVLAVTYYDFRNDDSSGELADQFALFCDPAVRNCAVAHNWGDEKRLTDISFDIRDAAETGAGFFLGDYEGSASAAADVHPAYAKTDGAGESSIYTRNLSIPAAVASAAQQ